MFGLLQDKDLLMHLAAQLMGARKGQEGLAIGQGLLGGMQARNERQQRGLLDQSRQQQLEMGRMQMEQMRRQQQEQEQVRTLASQAFAPGLPGVLSHDDEGHRMPNSGGGGMPEFARGMMGIDPMKGFALQSQLAQAEKPDLITAAPGSTIYDRRAQRPVFTAPEKTPDWLDPRYVETQKQIRAAGQPNVNVRLPEPEKAILKADEERLGEFSTASNQWRRIAQNASVINSVLKGKGGGDVIKLGATTARALGISGETIAAHDLAESLNTMLATQIRAPGSGSTSNMEFEAYRAAAPSLKNSEEGRALMTKAAHKFAERNAKLADHARLLIRRGKYSDEAMNAFDEKLGAVLPDEWKKKMGIGAGMNPSDPLGLR